jgi:hypothetical protein
MHNLSAKHCAQNTRTGYLLPRFVDPQILTRRWIERLGVNCTANGIDVPSGKKPGGAISTRLSVFGK